MNTGKFELFDIDPCNNAGLALGYQAGYA